MRVLVVEDTEAIHEVLTDVLEDEGHEVHSARDGVEAMEQLRDWNPERMLLDLMMPRMSGWEVLEQPEAAAVRTLVMTGANLSAEEIRQLGAPVLIKPLKLDDILAWLDEAA